MARLSFVALALLLVAQCNADGLFEAGQEYQYSYFAYTLTGIKEPNAYASSFGIKGNLLIQNQGEYAVAKLSDVGLAVHNGPEELIKSANFIKKPELAVLEKPFKILYSSGKISGFDADASDPEWSINIKKGLATNLQVDAASGGEIGKGENTFLRTVEDTVTGACNTTYSFGAADVKGRYSLIKQRTMSECTNVPRFSINLYGARNCAGKLQDEILATTQAYYQFSRTSSGSLKAHIISSLGYQVLQWHPPAGAPFYNLANQTMFLKSSGSIAKPISIGGLTKHYSNLRYALKRPIPTPDEIDLTREEDFLHPEEPQPQPALRTKTIESIQKLLTIFEASPLDESSLTDPTVMAAIQLMSTLNLDSLRAVFNDDAVQGNDAVRNLFVQMLPMAGSNPGALMIKELILDGKVSEREARRLVAFMPYFIRVPTEKLLSEYEILLKDNPNLKTREMRGAVALAFGHLIGVTCSSTNRPPCRADTASKYSRVALEAFKGAKTHQEQMVTLMALGNTRLIGAIEKLVPMTKPGAVSHIIRPHIIYNLAPLARVNRNKFLSVIMPIVLNQTEGTEVRVAAIATLFNANPTFLELQQVTAGILWERNLEFSNFVITTFKNFAQSKNPCAAPISNQLQLLLRRIGHIKTSPFRSSNRVFDYQDAKYNFGGGLQVATVYGEESRAPVVIAGRANYRVSEWNYVPLEIFIRLEGVEDAYVKMFRRLDPKDFKMDTLKDLLQKTLKVTPRQQHPMRAELVIRSQDYNLMYRHIGMEEIGQLMSGKGIGEVVTKGLQMASNMIMLGGRHGSWRANDIGVPVGVGLATPGLLSASLSYGAETSKPGIYRSVSANIDLTHQVLTYLVAYNPLGVSQGIVKARGSRLHLPFNAQVGFSPADNKVELKMITPTSEKPLAAHFTSRTMAFMWGKDTKKAVAFMKESCPDCEPASLVTKGESERKGQIYRDHENQILGLESHVEVFNCETYTGKSSIGRVIFESFKPSEINSHGSIPGYLIMGFMQLRNYFYYYPPTGTCSMKAIMHRTSENPAEAIEIKLKGDRNAPAGKPASKTKSYRNINGQIVFTGPVERKWNVDVNMEAEPLNVKSAVSVKIARLPAPELEMSARALCVNVKTAWAPLPEDNLETPSTTEPSVQREVSFVWGEANANECPKANAKGVSTIQVKVAGNITDAQRQAASSRDSYPYQQCDADRNADGRTGVATPLTQACYDAVMHYGTPRHYVYNINYDNLSERGMKALHRIKTTMTAALLPYWDMHAPHGHAPKKAMNSGHIELKLEFNQRDTDIHLHTDVLHSHFENIEFLDPLGEMILRNARLPMGTIGYYKAGLIGVCNVAPSGATTLDKVSMSYNLPSCWTLASADCSPEPRYAVFVKSSGKQLPLSAKIYVGGHSLELNPTDAGTIEIKANDKKISVDASKPYKLASTDGIIEFLTVNKVGPKYMIASPALKLAFRYTGDDLTAFVPATHRSQHCGLCGDFNGQFHREFVGPTGCALKDANDLVKAYVLKKDCKESISTPSCAADVAPLEGKARSGIIDFLDKFSTIDN